MPCANTLLALDSWPTYFLGLFLSDWHVTPTLTDYGPSQAVWSFFNGVSVLISSLIDNWPCPFGPLMALLILLFSIVSVGSLINS